MRPKRLTVQQRNQVVARTMLSLGAVRRWEREERVHPRTALAIEAALTELASAVVDDRVGERRCG